MSTLPDKKESQAKPSQAKKLLASSFLNFNRKKEREREKRSSLMSSMMETTKKGRNKRRDFIRLQQQQKRRKPAPLSDTHKQCKQQSKPPKHQRERENKIARETRRLGQVKNIFSLLTQVTYRLVTTYLLNKSIGK
jgi:3-hydroxyacyl-CoA dehydrogenase